MTTKALIIADPWIGYILDGMKTWEMRSTATSYRGWFGLIRKGSGAIYGVARLVDVGPSLSPAEMIRTFERHRIPEDMIRSGAVAKWNTPWKLADVRRLPVPVPYRHKSGAVTWVELDPEVSDTIERQLGDGEGSDGHVPAPLADARPLTSKRQEARRVSPGHATNVSEPGSHGRLIGQVELSTGNITNSHIYLRGFFDRFPADAVGGSNRREKAAREISVDWGGPLPVQTDLDGSKRFFRARGWVKAFFETNDAEPGDSVLVEETAPYSYRVTLKKAG